MVTSFTPPLLWKVFKLVGGGTEGRMKRGKRAVEGEDEGRVRKGRKRWWRSQGKEAEEEAVLVRKYLLQRKVNKQQSTHAVLRVFMIVHRLYLT